MAMHAFVDVLDAHAHNLTQAVLLTRLVLRFCAAQLPGSDLLLQACWLVQALQNAGGLLLQREIPEDVNIDAAKVCNPLVSARQCMHCALIRGC